MTTSPMLQSGDLVTPTVKLLRPLAEGGMGRVWVAEHLALHTQVVVKTMSAAMAARPDGEERFAREAASAAAIKSPHVVQVFDHGVTASGVPYIVMELLEGKDLGAYIELYGCMDPMDVVTVVVQVGKALSRAHRAGIVHRDVKPDNIFLCESGEHRGVVTGPHGFRLAPDTFVKLLDFGTARSDSAVSRTTIPGQIMGTAYYMSPEQSVGGEMDPRSDIWSLGVVAYEALTGRKAFDGPSIGAITIAIHSVLPSIVEHVPELSPDVDAWFRRCCAQLTEDRYPTVRDATNAFVEAVTGTAPVEMPTESLFAPPVGPSAVTPRARGDSTPVGALTRTMRGSLRDSLPPRGTERKTTTIAAGLVIGVAALAMIGIVLHGRSDSTPAAATSAPPPSVAAPLVPAITERKPPELSPVETVTEAPPPAAPAKVAPVASEKVTTAHKPSPAAHEPKGGALAAVPHTSLAKTPAATSANPGARPAVSTTSQRAPVLPDGDDDLVRLQRAAADRVTEANARGLASSVPSATENAPPPPLPPAP